MAESDLTTWLEQHRVPTHVESEMSKPGTDASLPESFQRALVRLEHVFGSSSRFPSFRTATTYVLYLTCVLLCRLALLDLAEVLDSTQKHKAFVGSVDRDLRVECIESAASLCRTIPYLLRSAGGNVSQAAAIRAPMYFFQSAFHRTGVEAEVKCMRDLENEMQTHFRSLNWDALLPWSFLALIWEQET